MGRTSQRRCSLKKEGSPQSRRFTTEPQRTRRRAGRVRLPYPSRAMYPSHDCVVVFQDRDSLVLLRSMTAVSFSCLPAAALAGVIAGPADIERFAISNPFANFDCFGACEQDIEWYVTSHGANFSSQSIATGRFPTLLEHIDDLRLSYGSVWRDEVFRNGPVYLGYRLSDTSRYGVKTYGWYSTEVVYQEVILNTGIFRFPDLVVLGSAAAVDEEGILVGTLQAIPEPTAIGLIAICCLAITDGRRRGR